MQADRFEPPDAPRPGAGTDRAAHFLDDLASAAPTPGGGGAAALMGAMAAALVTMAARLTLDKPGYEAVQDDMRRLLAESEALRRRATALVDEDATAVRRLMAVGRLPRATPAEQAAREAALQDALQAATQSPLACARACAMALQLAARAAAMANRNARPDVAVGALAASAGLQGAALTAEVNLSPIRERAYADAVRSELSALQAAARPLLQQVLQQTQPQTQPQMQPQMQPQTLPQDPPPSPRRPG